MNERRHGPSAYGRVTTAATTAALHTEHFRHPKRAVHFHEASISVTQHRTFLCLISVAIFNELWASAEARGAPDGVAEDANMDGILGDEELERVFESIDGARGGGSFAAGDQEADRRTVQALTLPHPISSRRHSGLGGPSIPLNGEGAWM